MKKTVMTLVVGLLMGMVTHMLYLDGVVVYEITKVDNCVTTTMEARDIGGYQECVQSFETATSMFSSNHLGKYFNIAALLTYKNVGLPSWSMK